RLALSPSAAYLAALAAGWAAMLAVDLPGHLSLDSLLELYEGRFRVRQSWAPSFYAWVLGVFDRAWSGCGLYVAVSGLLLVAALASFVWLRGGRASWWAALLALLFSASPLLLIYQGIVWKDVLFANTAVAGMVALAWAVRGPQPAWRRGPELTIALVLLAATALLRQNGVIVGLMAAAALGWIMSQGRLRRGLAWGLGALAAVVAVSHAMNLATQPGGPGSGDGMSEGMRVLQAYDILGAVSADPSLPLPAMTAANPGAAAAIRTLGARYYSAERTDVTDGQPQVRAALAAMPSAALAGDWRALILKRPGLYLRERAAVFRWVFLTPNIDRCLPVALGVQGPDDVMEALGLDWRWSDADDRLLHYDKAFLGTPVHSHLFYAALALAVALVLLLRREPADIVMIGLMAGALAFAASFFLISIACDFRYLYFLDLAAMAGVLYVAVEPPWARAAPRLGRAGRAR
ncbi:MAG: hypothetical protein JWQ97_3707, partial [Phenylobacterium sp.]|nr:hypothetical protein [Phenylobacterium sp.]